MYTINYLAKTKHDQDNLKEQTISPNITVNIHREAQERASTGKGSSGRFTALNLHQIERSKIKNNLIIDKIR